MCGGYKDGDGIEIPDPVYFNPLFVEVQKDGVGQVVGKKRAAEGIAGIFEGVKRVAVQEPFEDVKKVFRACGDDDAGRSRMDAPRPR